MTETNPAAGRRRAAALAALLAAGLTAPARAGEAQGPPADQTVDRLVDGMRALNDRFDTSKASYRIRYRERVTYYDTAGATLRVYGQEVDHARRKDDVSLGVVESDPSGAVIRRDRLHWEGKDGVCVQRKDDHTVHLWPFLIVEGWSSDGYATDLFIDTHGGLTFGSPSYRANLPGKNPSENDILILPRIVEQNRSRYRLRPRQEKVDGHWCHVLEWPGRDTIWLDAGHGYVARRRTFELVKGRRAFEISNHDLAEKSPGFYLPRRQKEVLFYGPTETPDDPTKVRRMADRTLTDVDFSPLTDADFEPPLKGLSKFAVIDSVRGLTYIKHPPEVNPLDQAIVDARGVLPATGDHKRWWLVNGSVLGLVSMTTLLRRSARRVAPGDGGEGPGEMAS
jgi:hypothetical protein